MKKKYIIIIISIVLIAGLIACGNIFAIKNINVVFDNNTDKTNEYEIIKAAGISGGTIIFNLRESEIKSKVNKYYKDNSIFVTNIERKFPNTVTIYVKERIAIFKVNVYSVTDTNSFVPVDKDFQMGMIANSDEGYFLIQINNFVVKDTFDLKECNQLRLLANTLIAEGIKEEALPFFIESINFETDYLKITLRESNATLSVLKNDVEKGVKKLYGDYLALDDQQRLDCNLIQR